MGSTAPKENFIREVEKRKSEKLGLNVSAFHKFILLKQCFIHRSDTDSIDHSIITLGTSYVESIEYYEGSAQAALSKLQLC